MWESPEFSMVTVQLMGQTFEYVCTMKSLSKNSCGISCFNGHRLGLSHPDIDDPVHHLGGVRLHPQFAVQARLWALGKRTHANAFFIERIAMVRDN